MFKISAETKQQKLDYLRRILYNRTKTICLPFTKPFLRLIFELISHHLYPFQIEKIYCINDWLFFYINIFFKKPFERITKKTLFIYNPIQI